jgi:hypothetical protein
VYIWISFRQLKIFVISAPLHVVFLALLFTSVYLCFRTAIYFTIQSDSSELVLVVITGHWHKYPACYDRDTSGSCWRSIASAWRTECRWHHFTGATVVFEEVHPAHHCCATLLLQERRFPLRYWTLCRLLLVTTATLRPWTCWQMSPEAVE